MGIEGSRIVVVGASSGIGQATSERAAAQGADVFMIARRLEKLKAAALEVARATPIAADVLAPDQLSAAMAQAAPVDHLVVTAAANERARITPTAQTTEAQIADSLDRVRGVLNVVRAAAPYLQPASSITLLCGLSAMRPMPGGVLLASESGAIASMARALARDLAPIRANAVMAGVVDTPIHAEGREDLAHWAESTLPARRFGLPQDIANAVLFAASNPYLTGSVITIDGGLSIV